MYLIKLRILKIQYEMSGNRFYAHDLEKLRGLKILNDGNWWFQIERLQLQTMPNHLKYFLHIFMLMPKKNLQLIFLV